MFHIRIFLDQQMGEVQIILTSVQTNDIYIYIYVAVEEVHIPDRIVKSLPASINQLLID